MTLKERFLVATGWLRDHSLAFVGLALIALAVVRGVPMPFRGPPEAVIKVTATSPGLVLGREDGLVLVHPSARPEELTAEGGLDERLALAPGRYDVRVLLTRAADRQDVWIRGLELAAGERVEKEVRFQAGELSVVATVSTRSVTDVTDDGALRVELYREGERDGDGIIASMKNDEAALVAAGRYDVRVIWIEDSEEKDVRWLRDVQVEAGLHRRFEVAFERGTFLVNAVNGEEPLPGSSLRVTLYRHGDEQRELVDSGLGGVPMSLATGRYDAKVTFVDSVDGATRWIEGLAVEDGGRLEKTVSFGSGAIVVDATLGDDAPLGAYDVYVYVYPASQHRVAIGYAPLREPLVVEAGEYDLRLFHYRSEDMPDIWLRGIEVGVGAVVRKTVALPSGKLLVRVYDRAGNELVGDEVFVHIHGRGDSRPFARRRGSETLVLQEGVYDVRVEDTRTSDEVWLKNVSVVAGELTERRLELGLELGPTPAGG